MSEMFSEEWMGKFMEEWNKEPDLSDALAKIGFNSVIAYGFDGDDAPKGYISIENGKATAAGAFDGQDINWDLRATPENWGKWMKKPPGMMGLGVAYTSRKLKFNVGDYSAMVKDPPYGDPLYKELYSDGPCLI